MEFSHPRFVSELFTAPSLLEKSFIETVSFNFWFFGSFVSQLSAINLFHFGITLQMNAFIASNEIVFSTHLQIQYQTLGEHVYCYSDERICSGDGCF